MTQLSFAAQNVNIDTTGCHVNYPYISHTILSRSKYFNNTHKILNHPVIIQTPYRDYRYKVTFSSLIWHHYCPKEASKETDDLYRLMSGYFYYNQASFALRAYKILKFRILNNKVSYNSVSMPLASNKSNL